MDAKKGAATVDEYIAQYPEEIQQILNQIRATIKEAAPGATEKISYQMPGFFLKGALVWFAVNKGYIGFYPTATGVEAFKEEVKKYETTKGSVHLPLDEPIPFDLIRRVVQFKVQENANKSK